jgi:hypothetical protein
MGYFIAKELVDRKLKEICENGMYATAQRYFDERVNYINILIEYCNNDLSQEVETSEFHDYRMNKLGNTK